MSGADGSPAANSTGAPAPAMRVAIIGAGPSAFYAADALLNQQDCPCEVDMFDRLPTPFGLVRHGVAPDHLRIKTVTKAFSQVAAHPRFRFFGDVEFGSDLTIDDIAAHYHQVLFATGAQSDRRMEIPGEDLAGSHPATSFVAWYNGHPDYRECQFDLSAERAVIVGMGNVAIDVARILCLTPAELAASDMAPHAVAALSQSRVREVYLLGRRGPAQAAFTTPELKELGELADADIIVRPSEAALSADDEAELQASGDRALIRKVELIQTYAGRQPAGRPRRLHLRFLTAPVEIVDDGHGAVAAVRIVQNVLERSATGAVTARPTDVFETLPAGLVFRSVGYRGTALPGVPFHERWGVILNRGGRVLDPATDIAIPGQYATGWIKRGPSGVIGTNKPDSVETVHAMVEDALAGRAFRPAAPDPAAVTHLLDRRGCRYLTFTDWQRLDAIELAAGEECGRPRVKFTAVEDMVAALDAAEEDESAA
ncbi:MAG: FAD-dependent oxidoreductase [Dehalococcoidia bacterium]